MYNNPYMTTNYMQNYTQQNFDEKIDNEIARLQQLKNRSNNLQPSINQTFQLAPTNMGIKFVNSVDDVKKELTIVDTPFINADYSILWIKNAKGEIRTFGLKEIIPKDDKDIMIENLQMQINKLTNQIEEMSSYEQQYDEPNNAKNNEQQSQLFNEPIEAKTTTNVSNTRTSKAKSK